MLFFQKFITKLFGIFQKSGRRPVGKIALKEIDNMSENNADKLNKAQIKVTILIGFNGIKAS